MIHPVTNEPIELTREQLSCVNYVGDKRKDLVIRSATGGGKTLVLVGRALEYLRTAKVKINIIRWLYLHITMFWQGV